MPDCAGTSSLAILSIMFILFIMASPFSACRLPSVYPQQPLRLLQQKLRIRERLVADVLPPDPAAAIDQEGAMQRHLLEVVIGPIRPEHLQAVVRKQRKRESTGRLRVSRRLLQTG